MASPPRRPSRPRDMRDGPTLGFVPPRAMDVVTDRQKMFFRQAIQPLDQQSLPAARLERRPRYATAISPLSSRSDIAMQSRFKLLHFDSVVRKEQLPVPRARPRTLADRSRRNGERVD